MRSAQIGLWVTLIAVGCDDASEGTPVVDASIVEDQGAEADVSPTADAEPDTGPADSAVDAAPEPRVWPVIAADNAVDPADPLAEGQHRFVYETWGSEQKQHWPPADFMLRLMEDEPGVFGDQFAAFGFVANPDAELPFGFARGSVAPDRVAHTCAVCHVARLTDGRVWLGAPNPALDFGRFGVEVNARWVAAGNPPLSTPLEDEKARLLGPGRTSAEGADYPQVVPADLPPYFRLATRAHFNYLGTGRDVRTESSLALYALGPGNPDDETSPSGPFPSRARLDPLVDYLGHIDAPANPEPPDAAQVARGAEVFVEAGCDACHHPEAPEMDGVIPIDKAADGRDRRPGDDPEWPDGAIHTSPLHRVLIDGDGEGGGGVDESRLKLILFIARHGLSVGPTDGYRVPTLEGLWATAPYLHNGSVPTLEALLDAPADRPRVFEVHGVERDTTLPGNSNRGHAFGVDLSPDDQAALVAWLRSR